MATSNISTNRAGEQALVGELSRRGANSIEVIPGRRRTVRVVRRGRTYTLRIEARRAGTWQTEESTHHAVPLDRITEWRDRWDQLGLD